MLRLQIPPEEYFNDTTQEFVVTEGCTLELEHSLASLSKWESKWEKPFLGDRNLTDEEMSSYIEMMVLTENVPGGILKRLSNEHQQQILDYVGRKMTATWFNDPPNIPPSREVITAEIIYYWMVSAQIPFECQHWHLNKLLTLIRVCSQKNQPPKKMSRREIMDRNRTLNAQRRAQYGTKG